MKSWYCATCHRTLKVADDPNEARRTIDAHAASLKHAAALRASAPDTTEERNEPARQLRALFEEHRHFRAAGEIGYVEGFPVERATELLAAALSASGHKEGA